MSEGRVRKIFTGVKHGYIKITLLRTFLVMTDFERRENDVQRVHFTQHRKGFDKSPWQKRVLTYWVKIPGPTCHVYLNCALLLYFMYNMPDFSWYCEGCLRPLDLGANMVWEAVQWEFEMMPINHSYPGIHETCALNTSFKALVQLQAAFQLSSPRKCREKKEVPHMHNYSDLSPTCQSFSVWNNKPTSLSKHNIFLIKSVRVSMHFKWVQIN